MLLRQNRSIIADKGQAAVFLFFRLAYESSNGRLSPQKFFYGYTVVPILIFVFQLTIMNSNSYKTQAELERKIEKNQDATRDYHDSDDELSAREVRRLRERRRDHRESNLAELDKLLGDAEERQHRVEKQEVRQEKSGVWGALHGKSSREQMLSPWFILITLLTVLQMLRMNFFIATIRSQYENLLSSEKLARAVNSFFDVALPVSRACCFFIEQLLISRSRLVEWLQLHSSDCFWTMPVQQRCWPSWLQ